MLRSLRRITRTSSPFSNSIAYCFSSNLPGDSEVEDFRLHSWDQRSSFNRGGSRSQARAYTHGDATFISLARACADRPSVLSLLRDMRLQCRPFAERVFFPIFAAIGRVGLPQDALHLFDEMSSSFSCLPSVCSLNSALAAVLSGEGDHRPHLALDLYSRSGISPNVLTLNLVMKALCRSGSLDSAVVLFREEFSLFHLRPDAYTYSTLIDGLCKAQRSDEAMSLLDEMQVDGISPTTVTFNTLLHAVSSDLRRAGRITRYMLLKGCPPNAVTYNILIRALCLKGKLDSAAALLHRMVRDGYEPNEVTYGTIVDGLVKINRSSDAKLVLQEMVAATRPAAVRPNEYVISSVTTGLFQSGMPDEALGMWTELIDEKRIIQPNTVLYTALIDGLCHSGRMCEAEVAFARMKEASSASSNADVPNCIPNVMTYSVLIKGYFKAGEAEKALAVWKEMKEAGCEPNRVNYSILIHGLCEEKRLKEGMAVWKRMLSEGCEADSIAYSSIIRGLCSAGRVDTGVQLFHEMAARGGDTEPDTVAYNIVFDGLVGDGRLAQAMELLMVMVNKGRCDLDSVTLNIFLKKKGGLAGESERRRREFLEGLVERLLEQGRLEGASVVLMAMLREHRLAPQAALTWERVITGIVLGSHNKVSQLPPSHRRPAKKVLAAIEQCWEACFVVADDEDQPGNWPSAEVKSRPLKFCNAIQWLSVVQGWIYFALLFNL